MTVIGILVFLELWHGIHPKKGKPSGFHPWLALAAPLFVAAGGIFYKLVAGLATTAGTVGTHTTSLFGG
jgi:hypothetical protein